MLSDQKILKVLSYNIHKGFTSANRKFVLEQIRAGIKETDADLVFLQEVLGEHKTHAETISQYPQTSQFEYLADTVWPHFAYGKNAVYVEGHHGNALLSKHAIEAWENINISTNRWEQRGLLHAKVNLSPSCTLHAFTLHLSLLGDGRRIQIDRICEHIRNATKPGDAIILAGDFNDWRKKVSSALNENASLKEAHFEVHGRYALSFPGILPTLSLDRIYFRGLKPLSAKVLSGGVWRKLSDHLPLLAEFEYQT